MPRMWRRRRKALSAAQNTTTASELVRCGARGESQGVQNSSTELVAVCFPVFAHCVLALQDSGNLLKRCGLRLSSLRLPNETLRQGSGQEAKPVVRSTDACRSRRRGGCAPRCLCERL
eukprot:scaffold878_cov271-Pinguiococcus_pyrenoidosus.AAC.25